MNAGIKVSKVVRVALALALSILMAVSAPLQSVARAEVADQAGNYLSEVFVSVASTPDEAAKALEAEGWTVLRADGKPADLNQGANSALKEDAAVVLGYRTTPDRSKAITDLAVMNMNGGYSFADYAALMDRYRDSQIRPFIDRFMATVAEYRANAASDNAGNRAKADCARTLLNRILEEDTDKPLGDLLLNQTRAEMGDSYEGLTDDQKKEHIDLETALMQGSASVVSLAEQLLAMAADTADTTWLERLSALGPNGLLDSYGATRPTDAAQDMAARYQDTARQLAEGWDDVRNALVSYDAQAGEAAPGPGSPDGSEVIQEAADEVGASELARLDVADDDQGEGREPTVDDAPAVLEQVNHATEAMSESADDVNATSVAAIYHFLKAKPYGMGTLYDLFTKPYDEVAADGCASLYPAASCLSAGQVAALEFLPLERLLRIGSTTGSSYAEGWLGNDGLAKVANEVSEVSLYQGVNREIFESKTALTSEALRAQALQSEDGGVLDFVSSYKVSSLLWAGTAVSAVLAGVSAYKNYRAVSPMVDTLNRSKDALESMVQSIRSANASFDIDNIGQMTIRKVGGESSNQYSITLKYFQEKGLASEQLEEMRKLKAQVHDGSMFTNPNYEHDLERLNQLSKESNELVTQEKVQDFQGDYAFSESMTDYQQTMKNFENQTIEAKSSSKWGTAAKVFTVATALLLVASIASTISDIVSYYNTKYAPIPKYIVEERDVTQTAEDGSKVFVRNDTAYYEVARTDASRDAETAEALLDYADLNGDKGKEWLALYGVRGAGEPILADSLKVVTGTSSVPDGYSMGIHMFGTDSAFNLTDARYCYNDDANGVYAYFKREAVPAETASVFGSGTAALTGGIGLVVGTALGAGVTAFGGRRRHEVDAV